MRRGPSKFSVGNRALIILSCFIVLQISCRPKESFEIKTEDGVKIINNLRPKWGDESKIELEFVRKIGGVETQDENYIFYKPFDMVQDKEGNKYVLTSGSEYCIRKFDPDWKYLKRFGARGEGPGEVYRTFGCAIDSQSNLYIISFQNRRLVILDPDGKPTGMITMPDLSFDVAVLNSGRIVLAARSIQVNGDEIIDVEDSTLMAVVDLDGEIIKRFVKSKIFSETSILLFAMKSLLRI